MEPDENLELDNDETEPALIKMFGSLFCDSSTFYILELILL